MLTEVSKVVNLARGTPVDFSTLPLKVESLSFGDRHLPDKSAVTHDCLFQQSTHLRQGSGWLVENLTPYVLWEQNSRSVFGVLLKQVTQGDFTRSLLVCTHAERGRIASNTTVPLLDD